MRINNKDKAFTILELLVVFAIIALIAALVLIAITGRRAGAKDARIQTDISQMKAVAEIVYNENALSYSGLCATVGTDFGALSADISAQETQEVVCYALGDNYCISASFTGADANPATDRYICISNGGVVGDNACVAADTVCN